jgi:XTP/dITP diphosphohydrolase
MENVPDGQRQARFVCAVALASPTADIAVMTDDVHGEILRAPRGAHGCGYEPLVYFPQFKQTTAELDMAAKSGISHRGKAFRRIIAWMKENPSAIG